MRNYSRTQEKSVQATLDTNKSVNRLLKLFKLWIGVVPIFLFVLKSQSVLYAATIMSDSDRYTMDSTMAIILTLASLSIAAGAFELGMWLSFRRNSYQYPQNLTELSKLLSAKLQTKYEISSLASCSIFVVTCGFIAYVNFNSSCFATKHLNDPSAMAIVIPFSHITGFLYVACAFSGQQLLLDTYEFKNSRVLMAQAFAQPLQVLRNILSIACGVLAFFLYFLKYHSYCLFYSLQAKCELVKFTISIASISLMMVNNGENGYPVQFQNLANFHFPSREKSHSWIAESRNDSLTFFGMDNFNSSINETSFYRLNVEDSSRLHVGTQLKFLIPCATLSPLIVLKRGTTCYRRIIINFNKKPRDSVAYNSDYVFRLKNSGEYAHLKNSELSRIFRPIDTENFNLFSNLIKKIDPNLRNITLYPIVPKLNMENRILSLECKNNCFCENCTKFYNMTLPACAKVCTNHTEFSCPMWQQNYENRCEVRYSHQSDLKIKMDLNLEDNITVTALYMHRQIRKTLEYNSNINFPDESGCFFKCHLSL